MGGGALGAEGVVGVDSPAGSVGVDILGKWIWGTRAKVRPGLSDAENVRRILAAAEKGYRQRLRQIAD